MNRFNMDFSLTFTSSAQGNSIVEAEKITSDLAGDLAHLLFMVRFEKDEAELESVVKDLVTLIKDNDIMATV